MEMYNVSDNGSGENYLIQGAESNPNFIAPVFGQFDSMYNEGAPDQGYYYPTATNYGYYCTGLESPGEWEDHRKIFGVDGPDFHHAANFIFQGVQTESSPYVYYTPSYEYAQSPYNPYNPYIPGAVMGVDGQFIGAQQHYTIPPYQDPLSSSAYIPVVIQPDIIPNSLPDPLLGNVTSIASRPDGRGFKHNIASASVALPINPLKSASNQKYSSSRVSAVPRAKINIGPSKQAVTNGSVPSGSSSVAASSCVLQGRTASGLSQQVDGISHGKVLTHHNQFKVALPDSNNFSDFGLNGRERTPVDKVRPKLAVGRSLNEVNKNTDVFAFSEQNRGPRTKKSKDQLSVKDYTNKAGVSDAQGNIIIYTDQYNKDDFLVDYVAAKFFVIKSYSEDDVHKSIKYGVWSSTSYGNKKLQSAYDDAQRIAAGKPRGCPIFLFFSVNASSQFCGVAEMIGPVDFYKDMDFWQQDKWSGSFPVKWHIIKDVANTCFRHIILENNENKPVTNSRDTQEIMFREGLEMLKIFKNHPLNTSLFDDFMYYENRQKFIQEEKARLYKSFKGPIFLPAFGLDKLNSVGELPSKNDKKTNKNIDPNRAEESVTSATDKVSSNSDVTNSSIGNGNAKEVVIEVEASIMRTLSIDSLAINPRPDVSKPLAEAAIDAGKSDLDDVFTVGSMPIKVNGFAESSGILKVGTIPLDPKTLQLDKGGPQPKN
ncbi:hypothetical protein Patl1_24794 [Pistacia atlantica]|uniref:Uncharacterized protein n=1 Tax=Pistacia atlantica TaxID=434234 RepID=A0ACC1AYY8_9ROSI|nr:hypothetical protein Patl1_24794 [Pistacia atlantica]